jgi:hypothetical protein
MTMSNEAIHLLNYFTTIEGYNLGTYLVPTQFENWFEGNAAACEQAQTELAGAGLIDLAGQPHKFAKSGVRGAALTREGLRFLQILGATAT